MRQVDDREHDHRRRHERNQERISADAQRGQGEGPDHAESDRQARQRGHTLPARHGDDDRNEQHGEEQQGGAALVVEEGRARLPLQHHHLHSLADTGLGQGRARVGRYLYRPAGVEANDHVTGLAVVAHQPGDAARDQGRSRVEPWLPRRRVARPQPDDSDDGRDEQERHHARQQPPGRGACRGRAAVRVGCDRSWIHAPNSHTGRRSGERARAQLDEGRSARMSRSRTAYRWCSHSSSRIVLRQDSTVSSWSGACGFLRGAARASGVLSARNSRTMR